MQAGLAALVSFNATHGVVRGRADGNWLVYRINADEFFRQRANKGQTLGKVGFTEVTQVKIDHIAARVLYGTAGFPFVIEGLREFVTRTEFHVFVFWFTNRGFRPETVVLQIAVTIFIGENATFAPATFGHQDAGTGQTGRVILHKFHVAQRYAMTVGKRHTVAGNDATVGVEGEDATGTAGCDDDGFSLNGTQDTVLHVVAEDTVQCALLFNQVNGEMFVQAVDVGELQ